MNIRYRVELNEGERAHLTALLDAIVTVTEAEIAEAVTKLLFWAGSGRPGPAFVL